MKTLVQCAGCERPILDRFLLSVVDRAWHVKCVKCWDCKSTLADKCFSRDGKLFCRKDFFRRFGTKCGGCSEGISPTDLVRRARGQVFHLACFTCLLCRKQLSTGEELYVLDENRFICKEDYITSTKFQHHHHHHHHHQACSSSSPVDSPEFDESLEMPGTDPGSPAERDNERDSSIERDRDLHNDPVSGGSAVNSPTGNGNGPQSNIVDGVHSSATDSCLQGSSGQGASDDGGPGGTKRRGPRTTIKAKQLETLKAAFAATPKPTRHIREQLAQETGLNMRVIQVWFQNRRSKERRMKQLSTLGSRRHFFRNPRRAMRPLRAGLGADGLLEDVQGHHNGPYPYFSDSSSPNDFGYGPHPGFYEYFANHSQEMTVFPGTMPIGPGGVDGHPLDSQNPPTVAGMPSMANGGVNLASDAPYMAPNGDYVRHHQSSPKNGMAIQIQASMDGYASRSAQEAYPNMPQQHQTPQLSSDTPVW